MRFYGAYFQAFQNSGLYGGGGRWRVGGKRYALATDTIFASNHEQP